MFALQIIWKWIYPFWVLQIYKPYNFENHLSFPEWFICPVWVEQGLKCINNNYCSLVIYFFTYSSFFWKTKSSFRHIERPKLSILCPGYKGLFIDTNYVPNICKISCIKDITMHMNFRYLCAWWWINETPCATSWRKGRSRDNEVI